MGVNEIINKVKADSEKIAADILSDARDKAEKIIDEANVETEKKKKAILEDGKKSATQKKQRIISDAKLRSKRIEWDSKEEIITEVLRKTEEQLKQIKDKGYASKSYSDILLKLIKEAAVNAGGGDLEVILCSDDLDYVSKDDIENLANELQSEIGKCSLSLSETKTSGLGGPILKSKTGRIEVNNTLDKRIERFSDSLRSEITKVLFGG